MGALGTGLQRAFQDAMGGKRRGKCAQYVQIFASVARLAWSNQAIKKDTIKRGEQRGNYKLHGTENVGGRRVVVVHVKDSCLVNN